MFSQHVLTIQGEGSYTVRSFMLVLVEAYI